MATVTPNFNWPVPTSTDLVKDGATAIEALGDSIDASLVDLKGGTTGQVLSKTSATDMDFTWVTSDDANAIQNAIVDAKGDLIAASAADTPARLAVGANGETLVADSSTSTGLRYTAGTVQTNPVLNSAMQVWQRGTSFSIAAGTQAYTADRYNTAAGTNQATTVTRQATADTTNLSFIQYCQRIQRNSGQTGVVGLYTSNFFENVNSIPFVGKTVTFSFYARAGANFSASGNSLEFYLQTGTGTDQGVGAWTGQASPIVGSATLTTTWQRFSATGTIATTATQIKVITGWTPTGTASTNDYYEVTGLQVDIGSVALPFRTYAATIQGELAACQRYYYRNTASASSYSLFNQTGVATNSTTIYSTLAFPVTMRTVPTSVDFSTLRTFGQTTGVYNAITNVTLDSGGGGSSSLQLAMLIITSTGLTTNSIIGFGANNSTSAHIGVSAEL